MARPAGTLRRTGPSTGHPRGSRRSVKAHAGTRELARPSTAGSDHDSRQLCPRRPAGPHRGPRGPLPLPARQPGGLRLRDRDRRPHHRAPDVSRLCRPAGRRRRRRRPRERGGAGRPVSSRHRRPPRAGGDRARLRLDQDHDGRERRDRPRHARLRARRPHHRGHRDRDAAGSAPGRLVGHLRRALPALGGDRLGRQAHGRGGHGRDPGSARSSRPPPACASPSTARAATARCPTWASTPW